MNGNTFSLGMISPRVLKSFLFYLPSFIRWSGKIYERNRFKIVLREAWDIFAAGCQNVLIGQIYFSQSSMHQHPWTHKVIQHITKMKIIFGTIVTPFCLTVWPLKKGFSSIKANSLTPHVRFLRGTSARLLNTPLRRKTCVK